MSFLINLFCSRVHASFRTRQLKAVMLALPELLSRCPASVELKTPLRRIRSLDERWFQRKWPGEDWETLLYTLNQACEAYCDSVPNILDRVSTQIKHFFDRNQRQNRM